MLKQNLSQRMVQKLSPQQIQLMKLLQIPTASLEQRVQEELESNPALEESDNEEIDVYDLSETRGFEEESSGETGETEKEETNKEEFELDDYLKEYIEEDPSSYKIKLDNFYSEEDDKDIPIPVQKSFHDYLENQIGMLNLDEEGDIIIARQIIGSIDNDGYLRRLPEEIIDDLLFSQNIETEESKIEQILYKIQKFDPPGVGARDLRENLVIQMRLKYDREVGESKKSKKLALKILENHFDEFTKKHYSKLQKNLFISETELKEAIDEILRLNPKPASGMQAATSANNQYIVPDFIISNRDGELELVLNSKNAPDLRINDQYMDMLKTYKDTTKGRKSSRNEKEAVMFIKQKIDSAKWFIDAIVQRQNTLYKSMYSIMQFQYDYFISGDDRKLKPMILKDIAEITSLDISTISRVANSKFVQTEFGTKRLKDFFSESIMTQDGNEVSTLEVKNILEDIIAGEHKRKPYSDEKLKDLLQDKGYSIARRTVAKYREQLNIPVARLRKEL